MIIRENHDINNLYATTMKRPSEVLGIAKTRPQDMKIPAHCCQKCGNCPDQTGGAEESAEQPVPSPDLQSDSNQYRAKVPVHVHGLQHFYDIVEVDDIYIPYHINIDYASWGINGISAHPTGKLTVPVRCIKYGDRGEEDKVVSKSFELDLNKLETMYDAAQIISPKELVIYIGPDHEVLYKRSYLTFNFISVGA
jgi:hypothetical protein